MQMFDSEYEAFKAYADIYPDNCVFLVDTYNAVSYTHLVSISRLLKSK